MKFVDQVRVWVEAGRGGDGAVAWRREAFVPRGGPAGGDGGGGGDVIFIADKHLSTLLDLSYRQHLRAEPGVPGGPKGKYGRHGKPLRVRVPVGTMVFVDGPKEDAAPEDEEEDDDDTDDGGGMTTVYMTGGPVEPEWALTVDQDLPEEEVAEVPPPGTQIGDLAEDGDELIVATGGKGGRGNIHFRTSTNRAPDHAEPGRPGQAMRLRLELKLLADVGIVGYPNVGKSTLISRISRARPKIADYPFTTLAPQLGVVAVGEGRSMVVADIPGLIDGASDGKGLGHQFLRHLERTKVLLHLLALDPDPSREPMGDLAALETELERYGRFDGRPRVVALNKADTLADPNGKALVADLRAELRKQNIPLFLISAATGQGVDKLLEAIWRRLS